MIVTPVLFYLGLGFFEAFPLISFVTLVAIAFNAWAAYVLFFDREVKQQFISPPPESF